MGKLFNIIMAGIIGFAIFCVIVLAYFLDKSVLQSMEDIIDQRK